MPRVHKFVCVWRMSDALHAALFIRLLGPRQQKSISVLRFSPLLCYHSSTSHHVFTGSSFHTTRKAVGADVKTVIHQTDISFPHNLCSVVGKTITVLGHPPRVLRLAMSIPWSSRAVQLPLTHQRAILCIKLTCLNVLNDQTSSGIYYIWSSHL